MLNKGNNDNEGSLKFDKDRRGSTASTDFGDTLTRRNTEINSKDNLRSTNSGLRRRGKSIKEMKKNLEKKGTGEFEDLEKNFKKQLQDLDPDMLEVIL